VNCSACRAVVYCGPRCQRAHWRVHKGDCRVAAKVRFQSALSAAEACDSRAQFDVGVCYEQGYGVLRMQHCATEVVRPSCRGGNADAQYNLGVHYENGAGIAKDAKLAVSWYQRAAEAGHAHAQYNLGLQGLLKGDGVAKDVAAGRVVVPPCS